MLVVYNNGDRGNGYHVSSACHWPGSVLLALTHVIFKAILGGRDDLACVPESGSVAGGS